MSVGARSRASYNLPSRVLTPNAAKDPKAERGRGGAERRAVEEDERVVRSDAVRSSWWECGSCRCRAELYDTWVR